MPGPFRLRAPAAALFLVSLTAGLSWPRSARAEDSVTYDVAAGCPDRAAFLAQVAQLSPARAPGAKQDARLRIEVSATAEGWRGRLYREDSAGASEPRVLTAKRCADLIDGLALTVALGAVSEAEPWPIVVTRAPATPPILVATPRRRRLLIGLGLRLGGFVADLPMAGLELTGGLAQVDPEPKTGLALAWEGHARASLSRSDVGFASPRARFDLYAAGVALCPAHAQAGRRVRLGLCALGEAGLLRGRGIAVANPQWANTAWLNAGAGASLRVALGGRWQALVGAQLARSLHGTRFVFAEPRALVAETTGWVASTSAAVALLFP
jgi:hypothetical protein